MEKGGEGGRRRGEDNRRGKGGRIVRGEGIRRKDAKRGRWETQGVRRVKREETKKDEGEQ